jgi:hypothetical protein
VARQLAILALMLVSHVLDRETAATLAHTTVGFLLFLVIPDSIRHPGIGIEKATN